MKDLFVADLQANQSITTTFLVKSKDVKSKKTGEPYLALTLGDRSGELDAKMWDNVEDVESTFDRDDFIKVKGLGSDLSEPSATHNPQAAPLPGRRD